MRAERKDLGFACVTTAEGFLWGGGRGFSLFCTYIWGFSDDGKRCMVACVCLVWLYMNALLDIVYGLRLIYWFVSDVVLVWEDDTLLSWL